MARKLRQSARAAEQDFQRIAAAVAQIATSPDLRFFFRDVFSAAGVLSPLPEGNALDTARAAGRQDLALGIIATFESHQPALWPNLILEDLNENANRTKAAAMEHASGGDAFSREHSDTGAPADPDEY